MSDFKLVWNNNILEGDFCFEDDDFIMDDGLQTSVLLSLFIDKKSEPNDELPNGNNNDLRGWFGELLTGVENDRWGSYLWKLERSKTTNEVLIRAKNYAEEALQWLIDDGIASSVTVIPERITQSSGDILLLNIDIFKPNGDVEEFRFDALWSNT